jgi:hypothetical protein
MDTLLQLLDFVLHVDRYLEAFVENYGTWVYALLFLIIFVETGLVVMPFLPGDSLLFVVGTLCGTGLLDLELVMALLLLAAIVGDLPVMRATFVRRNSGKDFTTTQPWDTVAPRLHGFAELPRFHF